VQFSQNDFRSYGKSDASRLDESNKGHQMLKKMGWGGSGLGASEQGIKGIRRYCIRKNQL
jgi:hypothetical protein